MLKLLEPPDEDGYSVQENSSAIQYVDLDGGPGRSRLDQIGSARIVSLQWSGGKQRWKTVKDFFTANVALNCPLFLMDLMIDDAIYQEYRCNVIPKSVNTKGPIGLSYFISAQFEVLPTETGAPVATASIGWTLVNVDPNTSPNYPYYVHSNSGSIQTNIGTQYLFAGLVGTGSSYITGNILWVYNWSAISGSAAPRLLRYNNTTAQIDSNYKGLQIVAELPRFSSGQQIGGMMTIAAVVDGIQSDSIVLTISNGYYASVAWGPV